jgi:hypothetical protein
MTRGNSKRRLPEPATGGILAAGMSYQYKGKRLAVKLKEGVGEEPSLGAAELETLPLVTRNAPMSNNPLHNAMTKRTGRAI